MTTITPEQVSGVVLAGGRARRMGERDKGLLECGGRPLVAYAVDCLAPLCQTIFINANRNQDAYRRFGLPVLSDPLPEYPGPLAGILAGLEAATTPYLLVVPCDSPGLQTVTLARLLRTLATTEAKIAIASDGVRCHPVVMALTTDLREDLRTALLAGKRKIDRWAARHTWVAVDCSDDPRQFYNINTPEALRAYDRTERQRTGSGTAGDRS